MTYWRVTTKRMTQAQVARGGRLPQYVPQQELSRPGAAVSRDLLQLRPVNYCRLDVFYTMGMCKNEVDDFRLSAR